MSQAFAWDQSKSVQIRGDVASGLAAGPNFWKSGDAETADASAMQVYAYADAAGEKPVDCTGGSPTMTVERYTHSTNPSDPKVMSDKYSWLITKPASNVQGQGIAFELDVDNSVAAVEMMETVFDYIVRSGTFVAGSNTTNSDLMVYLYDVTAGKLIEPQGGSKLYTSSTDVKGSYQGWFQSTLGSKKYRVCLHQATTSTEFYRLKVDAGKVQKSQYTVGNANNTFTARFSLGGIISPGSQTGLGHISGNAVLTDTSLFSIPVTGLTSAPNCTVEAFSNDATAVILAKLVSASTSTIVVRTGFTNSTGTYSQFTNSPYNFVLSCTKTGADYIRDAQMSDGYDGTAILSSIGRGSSNQTVSSTSETTILYNQADNDPLALFDLSSNGIRIKSSGWYVATTKTSGGTDFSAEQFSVRNKLNGSTLGGTDIRVASSGSVNTFTAISPPTYMAAGSLVTSTIQSTSDTSYTISANSGTFLSVVKVQGTAFMSPTAKDETHYAGTAGDTIGTSYSLIKFINKVEDTFGSYSPSTGLWTSKKTGFCSVAWQLSTAPINLSTSQRFLTSLYLNGTRFREGSRELGVGAAHNTFSNGSLASIPVNPGTTLSIYGISDIATTAATQDFSSYFTVSCR